MSLCVCGHPRVDHGGVAKPGGGFVHEYCEACDCGGYVERKRGMYLSPPELYALNAACLALEPALGDELYLVGSVMQRRDYRDVDVRCMLDDADFARRFPGVEPGKEGHSDPWWALVCTAISRSLSAQTGLRVDFQIQPSSVANRDHTGLRSALGMRVGAFA